MMAYLRALAHLVRHAGNERRHLYVLAAGGLGNLYNAVCLAAGRLLGYRLFIDHHSFSYLDRYDPVFGVLVRLAGPTAVHFVRCRRMARQLGDLYHRVGPIEIAPNLGPAPEPPPDRAGDPERPLVLGHLGNLSHNKGLDLVLAVACRARREGLPVRLVLAGPAKPADMPLILGADGVDYRGPVIGDDKLRFFKEIDVFLFPSRYRIETQPLVLVEATAYGVPVIATGRGCITDDFSPGAHVIVAPDDDFVAIALERLRNWTSDRSALTAARRAAWQQACVGHTAALAANADMIARLTGETP